MDKTPLSTSPRRTVSQLDALPTAVWPEPPNENYDKNKISLFPHRTQ